MKKFAAPQEEGEKEVRRHWRRRRNLEKKDEQKVKVEKSQKTKEDVNERDKSSERREG